MRTNWKDIARTAGKFALIGPPIGGAIIVAMMAGIFEDTGV